MLVSDLTKLQKEILEFLKHTEEVRFHKLTHNGKTQTMGNEELVGLFIAHKVATHKGP